MKIKDIEKQLKNEIEANSPAFDDVLLQCKDKEQNGNLILEKRLVPVTAGAPAHLQSRKVFLKFMLPILFALLAIACVAIMCYLPNTNQLTGGYFVIDINPSLEICYDKNGSVTEVTPLNEDAEVLLYEMDLEGKDFKDAISLLVDNCVNLGFLSPQRQDNAILTTAISEQGVKDEKMTEKIKEVFSDTLTEKNVQGEVLTGVQDEVLNKEAEKYGIDGQKLSLIQKYIEVGGEIEESKYSEITIRELYHSICQKEKDIKNEKIDSLKNEATQLENQLHEKITSSLDGLAQILPENSELKAQLDEIIENSHNDGAGKHIDALLDMLTEIENSELGVIAPDFISGLKSELENKNDEFKKAHDELSELNKTVEEKKNDRLNKDRDKGEEEKPDSEDNPNKEPHNTENGEAHFPKEDEHLPHNKDDENIENQPPTEEKPSIEEEPSNEEKPSVEEQPPAEEEKPPIDEHPHNDEHDFGKNQRHNKNKK